MNRLQTVVTVLCGTLLFALATAALAGPADEKQKPKNAATLDDQAATLTQTTDGKEKTSKVDLKYCLKVKGYFDKDGFNIEEVDADGPAARLSDPAGGGNAGMEKGDIITEVEGKKIKSAQDYAKALNGAADHTKTKIKVKDVNSGDEKEFTVDAAQR
ncbi:MAG TPA: PDZ domain-containing protein [Gemmataceae bacterium]|nr:PDZ domain-containing protein [Gemmataceae bacterium]